MSLRLDPSSRSSGSSESTEAWESGLVGFGLEARLDDEACKSGFDVRLIPVRLLSRRTLNRLVSERADNVGEGGVKSGSCTCGIGARQ